MAQRARSAVVAAVLFSLACSSKTSPGDAGTDGGGATCGAAAACTGTDNSTCPSQTNYTCKLDCCVFFCRGVSDCASDPCASSPLGCVCDLGVCQAKVCSADVDCGTGKVCVGGLCAAPTATAASCTVTPSLFVAHAGAGVQLTVAAFDATGAAVRSGAAPTFTVSDGTGQVDATGVFTDTAGSKAPGDVAINATVAGVSCDAHATVYAAPTSAQVTVLDANTALPITGATVVISSAANGTVLGVPDAGGDALGRYAIDGSALATGGMVSVFESNHQYASAVAPGFADGGTFGATPDLVFVLAQVPPVDPATQAPFVGGYTGDFSKGSGPFTDATLVANDVLLGIAGTAVPEDPAQVSLTNLLGPSVSVTLGPGTQKLPVGMQLDFAGAPVSCRYEGLGPSGGCGLAVLDGGDPFACADRPAWALGGPIPAAQLTPLISGGNSSLAAILTVAAPAFTQFSSGVDFAVPYTLKAPVLSSTVPDSCSASKPGTGTTLIPDPANLTPQTLALNTPNTLVANISLPAMPQLSGACVSSAIVLGGVLPPQNGLVPLGISAASIQDANGAPSSTCLTYDPLHPTMADGQVGLHLAPAHGGFEGTKYGVLALAGMGSGKSALSGLLQTFTGLPYGTPVTFGGQAFLGFVPGATYTAASRSFSVGAGLSTPPTLYRARFLQGGAQWVVQIPPGSGPIVLPVPPGAIADRAATPSVTIDALQLSPSASSTALVSFANGAAAYDLMSLTTAFSSVAATVN